MRFGRVARTKTVLATATAVLVTGGIAAASGVSDGTINACVKNGDVRIVGSTSDCKRNEKALTWNQRGPAGPKGERGPAGAAGPKGDAGKDGAVGPKGADGAKGDDGARGPAGQDGAVGPAGPAGPAGPKGDDGASGKDGAAGPKGDDGATGPAGPKGDDGAPGKDGAAGPAGPKGDDGAAGPAGPKGDDGARGPAGQDGAAGPKGDDGARGPAGPQGPKGDSGSVVRSYTVARGDTVRVPLLGGDGEIVLQGPDLCQYDYRNAGSSAVVLYGQDNAPTTVYAGSTAAIGRGYPAGNPGRERAVFDQGSNRTAKFWVAGYAVAAVPGATGTGCRFQVLLAE